MTQAELKERVEAVLAEEIGPDLNLDGSEIEVLGVDGGVVQVRSAESAPAARARSRP